MHDEPRRNPLPGTISTGLLERVKLGTPEAWERMVALYSPLISFWCRRVGLTANDTEDIVQDVLRTAVMRIREFSRTVPGGTFRGWLRTITRNKIGDFFRASARQREIQEIANDLALLSENEWNSEEGLRAETQILAKRVLDLIQADFSESSWNAFLRVVVDGASPAMAAEEFGMTANAVYLAKSRILRRVREELDDDILG